jgi:hypothetical protein
MKLIFAIESPEQAEKIQNLLFSMGCVWNDGSKTVIVRNFAYIWVNHKRITYSTTTRFCDGYENYKPTTLEQLFALSLINHKG